MSDPSQPDIAQIFRATGSLAGRASLSRMVARAAEIPRAPQGSITPPIAWRLATLMVAGFSLVMALHPGETREDRDLPLGAEALDIAYGTYLDVGWGDDLLVGDPLLGVHGELHTDEILESYDAFLRDTTDGS